MGKYSEAFKRADAAFNAEYGEKLAQLRRDAEMAPVIEKKVYGDLIKVVEQATKPNMAQAELCAQVKKLGDIAIGIARKCLGLPL